MQPTNRNHAVAALSGEEQAHSARLATVIRAEIAANGGTIPFSRFMQLALYAPGLGYYSAGLRKFGADGDFITAPELGPLFGHCVGNSVAALLAAGAGDEVVEVGAGSGALAVALLAGLQRHDRLPRRYAILEASGELRQRQQQRIEAELPQLATRVEWWERLPEEGIGGVVVANELLDALPVTRFVWRDGRAVERVVGCDGDGFAWCEGAPLAPELQQRLQPLALAEGYCSEVGLAAEGWVASLGEALRHGAMLLVDYGHPRREFYQPLRSSGTLRGYHRHRVHEEVLAWPGLQDLTAHVEFTAIAEAADAVALQVAGFTTQAHFLLDAGMPQWLDGEFARCGEDAACRGRLAHVTQQLTLPGEMGESFKALLLTRGELPLPPGFRGRDLRGRL